MEDNALPKAVQLAIAQLDKQFGDNTVMRIGSENIKPWPAISTGAMPLDIALGIGGLPEGRIVEIFGPESSGKSTLALSVVAEAQKMGKLCAFIDAEHSIDPTYAGQLGVNMDNLVFSQPDYGEQALDVLTTLIRTGEFGVIVVDSVAALTPKAEIDGTMEDNHMGLLPRMMSRGISRIVAAANETKTLIIFTNQLREKIGIMFGNPEITPGGRALRFYCSVRIDMRRKEDIKDTKTGEVLGIRAVAKVPKNKMAPALKKCEFDIIYGRGIDKVGCVVDIAVESEVMTKSGAWYSYGEELKEHGRAATVMALASDLDLLDKITEEIYDARRKNT
jgi:recombination protein RecA